MRHWRVLTTLKEYNQLRVSIFLGHLQEEGESKRWKQ
jgi:hypothetical protein